MIPDLIQVTSGVLLLHITVFKAQHYYPTFPRCANRLASDERYEEDMNKAWSKGPWVKPNHTTSQHLPQTNTPLRTQTQPQACDAGGGGGRGVGNGSGGGGMAVAAARGDGEGVSVVY